MTMGLRRSASAAARKAAMTRVTVSLIDIGRQRSWQILLLSKNRAKINVSKLFIFTTNSHVLQHT